MRVTPQSIKKITAVHDLEEQAQVKDQPDRSPHVEVPEKQKAGMQYN